MKNKEKILKAGKWKRTKQITLEKTAIRQTTDFSKETRQTASQWNDIFKELRENNCNWASVFSKKYPSE